MTEVSADFIVSLIKVLAQVECTSAVKPYLSDANEVEY